MSTVNYFVLRARQFGGLVCVVALAGCGGQESAVNSPEMSADGMQAGQVFEAMLATMGGKTALEEVHTLVMHGTGTRMHLGQVPATGAPEPAGTLLELVETIDFANGRAAFDNQVVMGDGFSQHRTEAYTSYKGQRLGWGTTEGRPNIVTSVNGIFSWATHNSPEFLLRRNPISVALAAAATNSVATRTLDGNPYWYTQAPLGDEVLGVYIDQADFSLHAFTAVDTETMWGDTNATYIYSDWRQVAGVSLPFALQIRKDDGVYADLQYSAMEVNSAQALAIFEIPPDAIDQAEQVVAANGEPWVKLEWNPVAEHVTQVVAFSHNSMVVEFPSFVVVVEGAYTQDQSLVLANMIEARLGKSVRYVVPTHPHFDHTGGLRALVSLGANVLTAQGHEAEILHIVESAHTNPPDALSRAIDEGAEAGRVEVFSGVTDIIEGDQQIVLYEVHGIDHVDPKVLAYVPSVGVMFQSDLFFGAPGPDAVALYQVINRLELDVQQIVGGHGGVLPYSALEAAVNPAEQ